MDELLESLLQEKLSSVEFVLDYLHLHFDGNHFQFYVFPQISINKEVYHITDSGYRDAICSLIGKKLTNISIIDKESINLTLDHINYIRLSLVRDDATKELAEFVFFHSFNKEWFVLLVFLISLIPSNP